MFLLTMITFGQNMWTKTEVKSREIDPARANVQVKQLYTLDLNALKQILSNAPDRFSGQNGVEISIPNVDGKLERYQVFESSNFVPELQTLHPEIRSYVGVGKDDRTAYLRFSVAPNGIQTMVLRADKQSEFIEPYTQNATVYAVYNTRKREKGALPFECTTPDTQVITEGAGNQVQANNQQYKTMRLALSCTGEYGTYFGGAAGALAAMNATMTRVNGVFEKDFSLHLNMINSPNIIFTNASTDPYSPASGMSNWNSQLQSTLTSVVGEANYDIGHLFGASGGGGNAGCIGCVCVDGSKGSGITSPADGIPQGDTFDIDYVAHEMGHQLGANHTFSHNVETAGVNVEPGSGSTIMGYAGITSYNVQMNSDDYFTYRSILQVQTNLTGKTCPVTTTIANVPPTVNAGTTYTIPKGTAFKLEGTATDPENNALTYCWEQNNNATSATTGATSICYGTKPAGPNFRSLLPKSTGIRYMPDFSSVLAGQLYNTWESVLDIARNLTFSLTVRDINGTSSQTQTASKIVAVNAATGPFKVTAPTENQSALSGSSLNVTWDVAGTTGSPINTANVKISLSTDNGATFTTLVASTANDGNEAVTIPSGSTTLNAYIMVEAVGNIYYAVSKKFVIDYSVTTNCNTYSYTGAAIPIADGTGANVYGATATSTLSVPAVTGTVSSVKVTVNATHTYIQDLVIGIVNPSSTDITLWGRQCANEDNMAVTFSDSGSSVVCASPTSGTYLPYEALSQFNGASQAGNWILYAADGYNGDTGSINSWSIEICSSVITALGVSDINNTDQMFVIYPNPNNGTFFAKFKSEAGKVTTNIFDASGKLIHNDSFNHIGGEITKEFKLNLPKGTYLLSFDTPSGTLTDKVVIK